MATARELAGARPTTLLRLPLCRTSQSGARKIFRRVPSAHGCGPRSLSATFRIIIRSLAVCPRPLRRRIRRERSSLPTPAGAFSNLAVSPLDTNHIAVSESGGILAITTDGGATRTERHLIALVPGYGGFNSNPAWANNSTLYISSENPNFNAIRLLKSTDGRMT